MSVRMMLSSRLTKIELCLKFQMSGKEADSLCNCKYQGGGGTLLFYPDLFLSSYKTVTGL